MAGKRYRHIFLTGPSQTQRFTNPRTGGAEPRIPPRDRFSHSEHLRQQIESVWEDYDQRQAVVHVERHGAYIDFVSEPGFELAIKSLESHRSGIHLLNVGSAGQDEAKTTTATVYIPHAKRGYFLKKIKEYAEEVTRNNQFKNKKLVESISDIRRSVLESFWRPDERALIPGDDPVWIEVWLSSERDEVLERFRALIEQRQFVLGDGVLRFPERAVQVIFANKTQLEDLIDRSDDIAEFRLAKEVASFFCEMENRDQLERAQELLARSTVDADNNVAVTILDSGINNGHLLINSSLEDADLFVVNPEWGTHDHDGHGTLMAGTVLYGDLLEALNSDVPVKIPYRLESVKILPPPPNENPCRLWGYYTAQGISRAEIQASQRQRVLCMAVTSTDDRDRGRPSSWSGEIDRVTSGCEDEVRRLFIVSAGNVDGSENFRAYPDSNLSNEVHDPGQAWNALTVGAYTEKVRISDPTLNNYEPIAPFGGLSPFSTTSCAWPHRAWPIKPEVVLEGGNVARGPNDSIFDTDDLKLLSTCSDTQKAQFMPFEATSAAAAQASWMAAKIQVRYPEAWPETIRGLLVHTAEWTDAMKSQFLPNREQLRKGDYTKLLRTCGYGVPDLERALYCAANSLTLISQAELQPYDKKDGRTITRDMPFTGCRGHQRCFRIWVIR